MLVKSPTNPPLANDLLVSSVRSMAIRKVGILGSGIMGSGIAEVVASSGASVVLRSRSSHAADEMVRNLEVSLAKQVTKEKRTREEADALLSRISTTTDLSQLADCDLVIESVVEDLNVKREVFKELDAEIQPRAILATNTSTLSVLEIASVTNRPDRVCGVHFFNPAPTMSLVEIVRPLSASDETIDAVTEFAQSCGKEPVLVTDSAGFIVNALLFPYLNDAVRLFEDGVASKEGIDVAMKGGCGFPMGPFALLDLVGLDTSVAILDALHLAFGDEKYRARPTLRDLVAHGQLGRKSGMGFYDYSK